jgi:hypothetical protein
MSSAHEQIGILTYFLVKEQQRVQGMDTISDVYSKKLF